MWNRECGMGMEVRLNIEYCRYEKGRTHCPCQPSEPRTQNPELSQNSALFPRNPELSQNPELSTVPPEPKTSALILQRRINWINSTRNFSEPPPRRINSTRNPELLRTRNPSPLSELGTRNPELNKTHTQSPPSQILLCRFPGLSRPGAGRPSHRA